MDLETFNRAIDRHIEHCEWMPKVSQIREAAMLNFVDKAGVPSPAEAWSEVSRHLRADRDVNVGTLTSVNRIDDHDWSHPIVREAADMLGWTDLWLSRDSNLVSNRARYMDTYENLLVNLKQKIQHTPDLRKAIEPPKRPRIEAPKKQPEKKASEHDFGYNGFAQMPEKAQQKLKELQGKMEVAK
jgi:hypothetical protein